MKKFGICLILFIILFTSCGKEREVKFIDKTKEITSAVTANKLSPTTVNEPTPESENKTDEQPVAIVTSEPIPAKDINERKPGDEPEPTHTPTPTPDYSEDPKAVNQTKIKEGISETVAVDFVPETDESENAVKAREILSKMSLEDKIAQMFIITPESLTGVDKVTVAGGTTKNCYNKYPVGGIIYFAGNLENPDQVKSLLSKTQDFSKERTGLPVFTCVDEEGGSVVRVAANPAFNIENVGHMAEVGMTDEPEQAFNAGNTIGSYLFELGFNTDFAPDADVLISSDNTLIRLRSFGTDADMVSQMALRYYEGLAESKVLGCYKHYPGHGATTADSHAGVSVSQRTIEELREKELVPFKKAAESGVGMIMTGHISLPNVTYDYTPSSMSSYFVTEVLRKEIGYKGIIVTDSLSMGAITSQYSDEKAAVSAVKAGNDMLLCPKNFTIAYNALINAVKNGEISEERINRSVERIIKQKLDMAL